MKQVVVVITAEGDSAETKQWYIDALKQHYKKQGKELEVLVLGYDNGYCGCNDFVVPWNVKRFLIGTTLWNRLKFMLNEV